MRLGPSGCGVSVASDSPSPSRESVIRFGSGTTGQQCPACTLSSGSVQVPSETVLAKAPAASPASTFKPSAGVPSGCVTVIAKRTRGSRIALTCVSEGGGSRALVNDSLSRPEECHSPL